MKKNIVIIVLSILLVVFVIQSFLVKQENNKLHEMMNVEIPKMYNSAVATNIEYFEIIKLLKEKGCDDKTIDSIWVSSEFLIGYEKALKKNTP